jgi:hypothetical protein
MKKNSNFVCLLLNHRWKIVYSDESSAVKFPSRDLVRRCERCHKKEKLIDIAEYKWQSQPA